MRRRIAATAGAIAKREREFERKVERLAGPPLGGAAKLVRARWVRSSKHLSATLRRLGRRVRPLGAALFRGLAAIDAQLRRARAWAKGAATSASALITPERAACAVVIGAAACLIVSQFVDYRGVQIGQAGYSNLPSVASAPSVDVKTAGSAHAYLLVPLAILAAVLAVLALRPARRRLGRVVFGLGLVAIAVILLVDLPAGLDAGTQASRFAGATAVLDEGFYAELAAAAGIALAGLLLSLRRGARAPSSARAKGARRRRRSRRASASPSVRSAKTETG